MNLYIYGDYEYRPIRKLKGKSAISQIVAERSGGTPVNFIVLDEIFASQDEERKSFILQSLGQLTLQFRQIFIITHVESVKDMLPTIIEITIRDEQMREARFA